MRLPYDIRSRRDRRPLPTNEATPVSWIAAAAFAFILFVAFVLPLLRHALELGQ